MAKGKHTPVPWGARGTMVSTPPPEECLRRIQTGEMPFTARRVCVCEPGFYVPQAECEANAAFIALAVNCHDKLLAACEAAYSLLGPQYIGPSLEVSRMLAEAIASAKASGEGPHVEA